MNDARKIVGVYLAAGSSRRMGTAKQSLEMAKGIQLGSIALLHALHSQLHSVVVVVRKDDQLEWLSEEVLAYVESGRCRFVVCAEAELGMAHSLKSGILAAGQTNVEGIMVMLADQPFIEGEMLTRLIDTFRSEVEYDFVASGDKGVPKPPVILGRGMWPAAVSLEGDAGARSLFQLPLYRGQIVEEEDSLRFMDIDTEERYHEAREIYSHKIVLD
ncbi:nucleotidyltransferase family protein [Paenibacillus alba]|uniref:Nucleotidyltransferase family protein n=1 Tax=Paenibacillus alba TaxID=1197127 RepID=A0ABU6FZG7_9BACL|nr:nucleotidyltransferase family protein [Paenibacillus alba]MEC0227297.1 nucleotidyltransferase family protein [Paenibacillus alba]